MIKEYFSRFPVTKKTISLISTLAIILIVSILLPAPAAAVPQPPHVFRGAVTVGGATAANGLTVTAAIAGTSFSYTPSAQTSGGRYGDNLQFKVPADDPDTSTKEGGVNGDTIIFYVEGVEAGTHTFTIGDVTQLNLSISAVPVTPPSAGAPGAGAGAGLGGVTSVLYVVTEKGRFTEDVTAISDDGKVKLFIPKDTIGLNRMGSLLSSISIKVREDSPSPPITWLFTVMIYEIGPAGAYFDPPIDLIFEYDESLIPQGVAEKNLVAATWDKSSSQWVELESTVDPETNTVRAKVSHFTTFALLAHTRLASFTIADLAITPKIIDFGEDVSISVIVTNTGDLTGSYEMSLKIDDMVAQTKEVTLDGGDSETISFSVTPETVGEHTVNIGDLLGSFEVKTPPGAPASFVFRALTVSPAEVNIGERVAISVTVTNIGDLTGTYKVTLKIDGVVIETKEVTLAGGASQKVAFTTTTDTAGTYSVDIDGLSSRFVVKGKIPPAPVPAPAPAPAVPEVPPVPPINWWLVGGIIAAVIIIGAVTWLVAARRRSQ